MRPNELDQSQFVEGQESSLPPPEVIEAQRKKAAEKMSPTKKAAIIGGGLFAVLMILLVVVMMNSQPTPPTEVAVIPTPTIPAPRGSEKLRAELERLQTVVDQADPESDEFPLPPVDMEVVF